MSKKSIPHFLQKVRSAASKNKALTWLGLAAALLLLILLFGDKPWDKGSAEGRIKISDYVRIWFWWAAFINLFIVGALAVSRRWWSRPLKVLPGPLFPKRSPEWFWPAVLLAVVFLIIAAWPRLGQSLWHDEANRVKNALVGDYREKDGDYTFRPSKWEDTLFYYRMPNHTLQSVLSRVSHEIWLAVARPTGYPLSETALRIPLLLVGCLGLVGMAVFLRAMGQPMAGVATAWILALHPWYVRYASEARGYILVMALIPVALLALMRAIETGKTRWWVVFGLAQAAMVYSYATAVMVLVVLNALVPIYLIFGKPKRLDREGNLIRWFVASLGAGMIFLQLFLPCLPQFLEYLQSEKGMGAGNQINFLWVTNFFSHVLVGYPWTISQAYESPFRELMPWAMNHPGLFGGIVICAAGFLVLGIRSCFAAGAFPSLAATVFLLPAILVFATTKARGAFIFDWYLVFVLPGVVALIVLGACDLIRSPSSRFLKSCLALVLIACIPAYGIWTQPAREELATNSLQPYREAVLATRPSLDPNAPGQENILTVAFHAGPLVYDPRLIKVKSPSELHDLIRRAENEKKDLFVNLAYLPSTAASQPANQRLVEKSGFFVEEVHLRGFNPTLSTQVFRYLPGTAKDFDFSPYDPPNSTVEEE